MKRQVCDVCQSCKVPAGELCIGMTECDVPANGMEEINAIIGAAAMESYPDLTNDACMRVADRAVVKLAEAGLCSAPAPLSPADLAILKRLRDNEKRASLCVGHLGDDLRRKYEEAVVLLDRLIGVNK